MKILKHVYKLCETLSDAYTVSTFQQICGVMPKVHCCISDMEAKRQFQGAQKDGSPNTDDQDITTSEIINCASSDEYNSDAINKHADYISIRDPHENTSNPDYTCVCSKENCVEFSSCVIENKFLYFLFSFGASLGDEIFFMTAFPFLLWNVDSIVARRLCLVWSITSYYAQALKDLLQWDRPSSPPVQHLEKRYIKEYSMPSTHAMIGTVIPFSLLSLLHQRYDDIAIGLYLVAVSYPILLSISLPIDQFSTTSPYGVLVIPVCAILACYLYPARRWTTSVTDTVTIVGVQTGVSLGTWLNWNLGYLTPEPENTIKHMLIDISYLGLVYSSLRFIIGVILIIVTRYIVKSLCISSLQSIYKTRMTNTELIRRRIEVIYKFVTYGTVAINASFTTPLIFHKLGILREPYYQEFMASQ